MKQATKLIHAGNSVDTGATPSLLTPIYETSTFVFNSVADLEKYQAGELNGYLYSRYENPTVVGAEQKVAAVEGTPGGAAVALTPFRLSAGGAKIESPPARVGAHTEAVLRRLGRSEQAMAAEFQATQLSRQYREATR